MGAYELIVLTLFVVFMFRVDRRVAVVGVADVVFGFVPMSSFLVSSVCFFSGRSIVVLLIGVVVEFVVVSSSGVVPVYSLCVLAACSDS